MEAAQKIHWQQPSLLPDDSVVPAFAIKALWCHCEAVETVVSGVVSMTVEGGFQLKQYRITAEAEFNYKVVSDGRTRVSVKLMLCSPMTCDSK